MGEVRGSVSGLGPAFNFQKKYSWHQPESLTRVSCNSKLVSLNFSFWPTWEGTAQPEEVSQVLRPEKGWLWRETARNVAVNPNSFNIRCLQELNESTPAAHVLSVCAYFPNLDMGSELQAPRAYVKLAWLSPFHSPDLAVAQLGDTPRHWDYRLQIASCLKPAPVGLAGPKDALAPLACPRTASCPRGEP